jgi:RNA polymerase primary sigma factor
MDVIKTYLCEIGRYPLLTGEQEIQLSRQIMRMRELQAMPGDRSDTEQREIKRGQRAIQKIMNCNLRLVVHIAKRYVSKLKCNSMDMMDLIQEGSLGLHRAAELFDGTKGYKFSTYAYWWIRQSITRAIDSKERLIRVPQHMLEVIYRASKLDREYMQRHGQSMPLALLAEELEIGREQLQSILKLNIPHGSLDTTIHDDGTSIIDLIAAEAAPTDDLLTPEYVEQLQLAFFRLDDIDRHVLSMHYGLDGEYQSQAKIASSLNVSRSAVGQRHTRAIRRMRFMMAS